MFAKVGVFSPKEKIDWTLNSLVAMPEYNFVWQSVWISGDCSIEKDSIVVRMLERVIVLLIFIYSVDQLG